MRLLSPILLALVLSSPSLAQSVNPERVQWSVSPPFAKDAEARRNISGAACAPTTPALRSCLAVNDQKKYAQFFSIAGEKIVPGAVMRLLGDNADSDPDTEGVAFHRGYFYMTGSHGVARKSAKEKTAPFTVFRFKVDAQTGKPAFEVSDKQLSAQIEKSTALRAAIRAADPVGIYAERPLGQNGVNIEGLALDGDRIYFGFRGPSVEGRAFIISAAIEGMFGMKPLDPKTHPLALGPNTGIRDLAPADDGMLLLSGAVNEQSITPAVWRWSPSTGNLKKLADLADTPHGAKAETLLVLEQTPEQYRVLIMYDGPDNGAPMEYRIPRQ